MRILLAATSVFATKDTNVTPLEGSVLTWMSAVVGPLLVLVVSARTCLALFNASAPLEPLLVLREVPARMSTSVPRRRTSA